MRNVDGMTLDEVYEYIKVEVQKALKPFVGQLNPDRNAVQKTISEVIEKHIDMPQNYQMLVARNEEDPLKVDIQIMRL